MLSKNTRQRYKGAKMKKIYIIMAVGVTAMPLVLAAAIKSVIPIVFWFFPVATFLFISRGIRMNKTQEKEKKACNITATTQAKSKKSGERRKK